MRDAPTLSCARVVIAAIADLFGITVYFHKTLRQIEVFKAGHRESIRILEVEPDLFLSCKKVCRPSPEQQSPDDAPTQRETHQQSLRRGLLAPHMQGRNDDADIPMYAVASVYSEQQPSWPPTPLQRQHSGPCPLQGHLSAYQHNLESLSGSNLVLFSCFLNGRSVVALFDPGSEFTMMKPSLLSPDSIIFPPERFPGTVDRTPLRVDGMSLAEFRLGPIVAFFPFYVSPTIGFDVVLGIDWIRSFGCVSCFPCNKLILQHNGQRVLLQDSTASRPAPAVNALQYLADLDIIGTYASHRTLRAVGKTTFGPGETLWVPFSVHPVPLTAPACFTPSECLLPDGLLAIECVIDNECKAVPLTNVSDVSLTIGHDRTLGHISPENSEVQPARVDDIVIKNPDHAPSAPPCPQVCSVTDNSKIKLDVNTSLSPDKRAELLEVLNEFTKIFYRKGQPLPCTNLFEAKLELHDNTLYYVPQYRLSPAQLKAAEEEIKSLLQTKTIKEANSHFCLSLLVVPKATPVGEPQKHRVVLDARPLNKRLKLLNFRGVPSFAYLEYLQNKKYFSQFDLKSSYQQIRLHPDSQQYLAFQLQGKSYVYTSLPFGVASAGEYLQIAIHQAMSGLMFNGVVFYVDDGTCATTSWDDHITTLRAVFERFRRYGFVLNPEKCRFGYFDARALGMVVTQHTIEPDVSRIRPLEHLTEVHCKKRAKGVVAYFSFFRKFLRNYATRAHILFEASNPNMPFNWGEQHKTVVRELYNELLASALRHFHEERPSRLLTDGSREGIGAVFTQLDPVTRLWHPVSNHSRMLSKTEKNYNMTAIELLAISDACIQFRKELQSINSPCEVHTDCQAVVYLYNAEFLPPVIARLMTYVRSFDLKLKHVAGQTHLAADALSRNPLPSADQEFDVRPLPGEDVDTINTPVPAVAAVVTRAQASARRQPQQPSAVSRPASPPANAKVSYCESSASASESESADEELSDVDGGVSSEGYEQADRPLASEDSLVFDPSEYQKQQHLDPDVQAVIKGLSLNPTKYKNFQLIDSILYRVKGDRFRFYTPAVLREEVIKAEHEFGHFGIEKTVEKVARSNYWPSLPNDCARIVAACKVCQRFKRKSVLEGHLQSITSTGPNDLIFMDFKATPPSRSGNQQVLVYVDAFTRFVRLFPTKGVTAKDAIRALRKAFAQAGIPRTIVGDDASAFNSREFREFIKEVGVSLHVVPANAHQANGLAEAYVKTAGERIALMCHAMLEKWDKMLPDIQLAINDSHSRSLNNSPFFLQFGYHPRRSKLHLLLPRQTYKTVREHLDQLWEARARSQTSLAASQEQAAARYNAPRKPTAYKPQQLVWVYFEPRSTPECPKKFAPSWREGRVIRALNPVTYLVETTESGKLVSKKVHINFLKKRPTL